jgi:hypothetical protein
MRFCLAGIVIFAAVCLRFSGCLLVLNNGVSSDVAVAEGGDDRSYWAALAALRRGEVRYVLLDLSSPDVDDDLDSDTRSFLARTAPDCADRILSVPSSAGGVEWLPVALTDLHPHSVLIVAPEFRSRLELARFRRLLPQYRWSVRAVRYPDLYDRHWWRRRAWAKRFASGAAAWARWELLGRD